MSNSKETVIHTKTATFTIIKMDNGGLTIYKTKSEDLLNSIEIQREEEDYNSIKIY